MTRTFFLRIVTPFGEIFSERATGLVLQGKSGAQTVLAGHAPLVATVEGGICLVRAEGEKERRASVGEGVLSVSAKEVLLVCERCVFEEK